MNTYHLKYFMDAAQTGSLSASAKINNVTQAAVSRAVRSLETELGVELLHHGRRRFQITESGEQLLSLGNPVRQSIDALREHFSHLDSEPSGELHLGATQTLVAGPLLESLQRYQKKYPRVGVQFTLGATRIQKDQILSGNTEMGFVLDDGNLSDFDSKLLGRDRFVVVGRPQDFKGMPERILVTGKEKAEVQHFLRSCKRHYGRTPEVLFEIQSWGVLLKMAAEGIAPAYVPGYILQFERTSAVPWKAPFPLFEYQVRAIWRKTRRLTQRARLFLDEVHWSRT